MAGPSSQSQMPPPNPAPDIDSRRLRTERNDIQRQEPPSTPWKARYGGWNHPRWADQHSSGLAPIYPNIEIPIGIELGPLRGPYDARIAGIAKPPDPELDRIFCTERYQQQVNCGIRSWELGIMNQALPGLGDPQDPGFLSIEVHPETWCTAFDKLRWFDLVPSDLYHKHWTVDDNDLWGELRVVIELTNRILWNHLASSEWFQALLHGPRTKMPGERLAENFSEHIWKMETSVFREDGGWDEEIGKLWDELQVIGQSIVWTFFDPDDPERYGSYKTESSYAYAKLNKMTEKSEGDTDNARVTYFASCHLNVGLVGRLLVNPVTNPDGTLSEPDLNRAERYNARVHLAKAMLHELMHAVDQLLSVQKFTDEIFKEVIKKEPFFEDERVAELGYSSEQALWGGVLLCLPNWGKDQGKHGGPYLLETLRWPDDARFYGYPSTVREEDGPDATPRHQPDPLITKRRPLPTFWAASLQNELYWQGPWARYGSSSIYPDDFMATNVRYSQYNEHNRFYHARMENDREFFGEGLKGSYERTIDYMRHRQSIWRVLRPWYDQEYRRWQSTPYSLINLRAAVEKFTQAVAHKDLLSADDAIADLQRGIRNALGAKWLTIDDLETESPLYIFVVLEGLMIAAAPWMPNAIDRLAETRPPLPNRWKASASARLIVPREHRFFFVDDFKAFKAPTLLVGGYNPLSLGSKNLNINESLSHDDAVKAREILIHQASKYMVEPASRWPLPRELYNALARQINSLKRQVWGPEANNTWLDFTFTFPDYNAADFARMEAPRGKWTDIAVETTAPTAPPEVYRPSPEPAQSDLYVPANYPPPPNDSEDNNGPDASGGQGHLPSPSTHPPPPPESGNPPGAPTPEGSEKSMKSNKSSVLGQVSALFSIPTSWAKEFREKWREQTKEDRRERRRKERMEKKEKKKDGPPSPKPKGAGRVSRKRSRR
ncbi:hypothetical protein B0T19DRAFT_467213 [Cercophora scortea]|uniref:Uncharacterized protein n=1 Tax=Cercophora scortea TaxID=314031 RepID=A0AAE0M5T3_9PEZI|nr:hypothetical protein B0T19DRAFT_467213 [Cercophora scortea]